jgi:hypothetical protein
LPGGGAFASSFFGAAAGTGLPPLALGSTGAAAFAAASRSFYKRSSSFLFLIPSPVLTASFSLGLNKSSMT